MEKVGRYNVSGELGAGGMGVVYKAYDPEIGRDVAIKVIAERLKVGSFIKERFKREARAQGALSHENITIVHDVGEEDGRPFIVMEYLEGTALRSLIKREKALPLHRTLSIAVQICKGLRYAHSRGVIHRDIKPGNIQILNQDRVKIMDFGLAKPEAQTLTGHGEVLGTPAYMSPEQIRGKKVDARSDVFSFGVLFYELLAAERPFAAEEVAGIMYQIVHEEPPPLTLPETDLHAELQRVVFRCLEKEEADRYDSFEAVLNDLEPLCDRAKEKRMAPENTITQTQLLGFEDAGRPRARRSGIIRAVLAAVVAAVVVAGGYLIVSSIGTGSELASGEPVASAPAHPDTAGSRSSDTTTPRPEPIPSDPGAASSAPPLVLEETDDVGTAPVEEAVPEAAQEEGAVSLKDAEPVATLLSQDVEQARNAMLTVKLSVPGRGGDRNNDPYYQQALALEETADRQMQAGLLDSALVVFQLTTDRYREAVLSVTETLKSSADAAKTAMTESKHKVDAGLFETEKYKQATAAQEQGDTAYEQGDFGEARIEYQEARLLYGEVIAAQAATELAVRRAVEEVRTAFKESIEQEDVEQLCQVYQNVSDCGQDDWATLFKVFRILEVNVGGETMDQITARSARLNIVFVITYNDNKNRRDQLTQTYTWTLGEVDGLWKITNTTAR